MLRLSSGIKSGCQGHVLSLLSQGTSYPVPPPLLTLLRGATPTLARNSELLNSVIVPKLGSLFTNLHMGETPGRVQGRNFHGLLACLFQRSFQEEGWWGAHWGLSSRDLSVGPGFRLSPRDEELRVSGQVVGTVRSPKRLRPWVGSGDSLVRLETTASRRKGSAFCPGIPGLV